MDIQNDELKEYVKQYLKENLSVSIEGYTSSSSWSTQINVSVCILLEGVQISYSDSNFEFDKS